MKTEDDRMNNLREGAPPGEHPFLFLSYNPPPVDLPDVAAGPTIENGAGGLE